MEDPSDGVGKFRIQLPGSQKMAPSIYGPKGVSIEMCSER
jgi:hypothetical protein